MADIVSLVQKTQRERIPVSQFLREWADALESDEKTVGAVLILHADEGSNLFRTSSQRCNMSKIEAAGLMQFALVDICNA